MIYRDILTALKAVKSDVERGDPPSVGICSAVTDYMPRLSSEGRWEVTNRLYSVFPAWPEFSGHVEYPVPGTEGCSAQIAYQCRVGRRKWSGPYGESRKRLLDFLIQHFEEVTSCSKT